MGFSRTVRSAYRAAKAARRLTQHRLNLSSLRLADGPDEVHRAAMAKLEPKKEAEPV